MEGEKIRDLVEFLTAARGSRPNRIGRHTTRTRARLQSLAGQESRAHSSGHLELRYTTRDSDDRLDPLRSLNLLVKRVSPRVTSSVAALALRSSQGRRQGTAY